jgi:hypothetical protein
MYPPSSTECIKLLKSFIPPEAPPALPVLPRTPTKAIQAESMLFELEHKILEPLSSATKLKFRASLKAQKRSFILSVTGAGA